MKFTPGNTNTERCTAFDETDQPCDQIAMVRFEYLTSPETDQSEFTACREHAAETMKNIIDYHDYDDEFKITTLFANPDRSRAEVEARSPLPPTPPR